ncbi:hypothetical protein LZ30DRAFT_407043 [Colletotrichum cereale]|nr:hypothetical protein LZ30DRAFT_407043 [Colletotrichum cereale]
MFLARETRTNVQAPTLCTILSRCTFSRARRRISGAAMQGHNCWSTGNDEKGRGICTYVVGPGSRRKKIIIMIMCCTTGLDVTGCGRKGRLVYGRWVIGGRQARCRKSLGGRDHGGGGGGGGYDRNRQDTGRRGAPPEVARGEVLSLGDGAELWLGSSEEDGPFPLPTD